MLFSQKDTDLMDGPEKTMPNSMIMFDTCFTLGGPSSNGP